MGGLHIGRTVRSYRQALENEIQRWKSLRKGLRRRDAEVFDQMMSACRMLASAGSMATRPILTEVMFMSILLHQEKTLTELTEKFKKLETNIRAIIEDARASATG